MSNRGVLAIDAGQTGMKVRLTHQGESTDILFPGIRTHEPLLPQLADVARATIERTGATPHTLTAGVSGLTDRDADPEALLALVHGTGIGRAVLAHDSTTSFLGALGDRRGAVVAAGTGVVTLAVGRDAIARVDGWGYLMGDAGSGYWIGRAALDAVMRAYDGRGAQSALTAPVLERWPDLAQAYIALQASEDRVSLVASFARAVATAADAGDAVALALTHEAAAELAHSAMTAIDRVAGEDYAGLSVCAIGGVFHSQLLLDAFTTAIARRGLSVVPPGGAGIDGTVALAALSAQHPLASVVHTAEASTFGPGEVTGA